MSVIRATIGRTTPLHTLRITGSVLVALAVLTTAVPPLRLRVVRHPLDVGVFVLMVAAVLAFWALPSDFTRRLKRNPLSIAGFSIIFAFIAVAILR